MTTLSERPPTQLLDQDIVQRVANLRVRARARGRRVALGHPSQPAPRGERDLRRAPRLPTRATTCACSTGARSRAATATRSSTSSRRRTCARSLLLDVSASMAYDGGRPATDKRGVRRHACSRRWRSSCSARPTRSA